MKLRHIKQDIIFVFESEDEIKTFEKMLKKSRKSKLSHQYFFTKHKDIQFSIHNGKPSIPEYNECKNRSGLLTDKPQKHKTRRRSD